MVCPSMQIETSHDSCRVITDVACFQSTENLIGLCIFFMNRRYIDLVKELQQEESLEFNLLPRGITPVFNKYHQHPNSVVFEVCISDRAALDSIVSGRLGLCSFSFSRDELGVLKGRAHWQSVTM